MDERTRDGHCRAARGLRGGGRTGGGAGARRERTGDVLEWMRGGALGGNLDAAAARARRAASAPAVAAAPEGNHQPGRAGRLRGGARLLGAERPLRQRTLVRLPVPVHAERARGARLLVREPAI